MPNRPSGPGRYRKTCVFNPSIVQTEPVTGSQVTSSGSSLPAPRVSKLVTMSSLLPKRVSGPAATSNTSRLLSSETSRWWVAEL